MKSVKQIKMIVPIVKAHYAESEVPEYRNNPLIEALPPIKTFEDWIEELECPLPFTDNDRSNAKDHVRAHRLSSFKLFYEPLPRSIEMCEKFDELLRASYVVRNPSRGGELRRKQEIYDLKQQGHKVKNHEISTKSIYCTAVIGMSGLGKTTSAERALSAYPQVIFHEEFGFHQIVWLKVDCPKDGNTEELLLKFVNEIDRVTGTLHRNMLRKTPSYRELLNLVRDLIDEYYIGIIVIDELQNLNVKRDANRECMLNLLQEIVNEKQVALVVMGTYKAQMLVNIDMRHGRRLSDFGSMDWPPLEKGFEWESITESLWNHQLLKNVGPLDHEMSEYLHDKTQGIIAVLVAAMILAQRRAMRTGEEILSRELFERVFEKDLKILKPMLAALRSKDPKRIARYQDMCSEVVNAAIEEDERRTQFVTQKRGPKKKSYTDEQVAISTVENNGYSTQHAKHAVRLAIKEGAKTKQAMVNSALVYLQGDITLNDAEADDENSLCGSDDKKGYDNLLSVGAVKGIK
jgi:hypothetical protein